MFSTNWCQDLRSVNNNMIPRNEILKEVNNILETLHSIVYKLSVSQSVPEVIVSHDFHQEEMWWDDDYISLSMSMSQDVNNNYNSISCSSDCSSVISDDILQNIDLFPEDNLSDEEQELSIADRVKLRKLASTASVPDSQEQLATPCDPFVEKMGRFINSISPGNIFSLKKSRRKKKRRAAKMIHPDLLSLWNNVGDLFGPKVCVSRNQSSMTPVVDWEKVNKRFISNIPEPSPQALYGCSEDPEFYETKHVRRCQPSGHVTWEIKWSKHKSSKTPFGSKPGYLTDAGVINADSNLEVVHGYVWSPSCHQYILHAKFPGELERSKVSSKRRRKKRGSR